MWFLEGLVAGIIAGVFMIIISDICYRVGVFKSNLIIIDGSFALRLLKRQADQVSIYVSGIIVHLGTSAVFGGLYSIIAEIIGFEMELSLPITVYVIVLWIAMLYVALPVSGQGFMGNKIGKYIWVEQIVLHIVFGFGFWWSLSFLQII
ncbi:hypothetical protein ACFLY3_00020 [Chloroflexota bacterium]